MPYYHCMNCHHEFEHIPDIDYEVEKDWSIRLKENMPKCDWCKGETYILEEKTPLERMCEKDKLKKLLGELVAYENKKSCNNRKH